MLLMSMVTYMVKVHPYVGVANVSGCTDDIATPW